MTLFVILACAWVGLFLLALGLAAINSRPAALDTETSVVNFRVNPAFFQPEVEDLEPLRKVVNSRLRSPTDRRAKRLTGEKEVIFVVDDDPDILKLIEHVLEIEGFEVKAFTDPELALEEFKVAERRPQMVVTDYCMQPMNGLELISQCRQQQPDLKTVVISGMVDEREIAELPNRTDRFIQKPFKVANLVQTLNTLAAQN